MGFYRTAKGWTVSLYHAKHRTDLDLSAIATKFGGGGHRGACGFQCETLPFLDCGGSRTNRVLGSGGDYEDHPCPKCV